MRIYRALAVAAGASVAALSPSQAAAQVDGAIVLNILRECAKIGDASARLACYDNNIRSAGNVAPQAASPSQLPAQTGAVPVPQSVPQPSPAGPAGFGADSIRTPQARAAATADRVDNINARVAQVTERQPGVYLVELEDGAQWLFNEGVSRSYKVPTSGSSVEIQRAALGSFLLRFDGQQAVRVRRIR